MIKIQPSSLTTVPNVIDYVTNGILDFMGIVAVRARGTHAPGDAPDRNDVDWMKDALSRLGSKHVEDATNVLQYQEVNDSTSFQGSRRPAQVDSDKLFLHDRELAKAHALLP